MQCLAWVVSTVILKFMLSVIFGASDDVSRTRTVLWTSISFRGPLNTLLGFWNLHFVLNYRPTSAVWSNPSSQATKTLTRWCTRVLLSLTSSKHRWVMWSISLQSVISFPLKLFFIGLNVFADSHPVHQNHASSNYLVDCGFYCWKGELFSLIMDDLSLLCFGMHVLLLSIYNSILGLQFSVSLVFISWFRV